MGNHNKNNGSVQPFSEKALVAIFHLIIIFVCGVCLYSFLIVIGSSFQTQNDIMTNGYSVLPKQFSLDAYKLILKKPDVLLNSYLITIITTLIGTILGLYIDSAYAYVLSRKDYRYRKILSFYIFFTMLFNGGLVASYILITQWLKLKDTMWVLILPALVSPWYIMLMKGFFQSNSFSLTEAAKIDGAKEFQIFFKIIVPISKPAFATIALFYTLQFWNDWWLSLLFIESEKLMKLQYVLIKVMKNAEFLNSADALQYGLVKDGTQIPTLSARMAMCVLAAGPVTLIFPFFQKYFVKGLTVGSIKG